jgi:hypothetical protein
MLTDRSSTVLTSECFIASFLFKNGLPHIGGFADLLHRRTRTAALTSVIETSAIAAYLIKTEYFRGPDSRGRGTGPHQATRLANRGEERRK